MPAVPNRLVFISERGDEVPYLPPRTDAELGYWCDLFFGLKIADRDPCPGHVTPLKALADAYFARYPLGVWKASRALGGKSSLLAALSMLELLASMNVVILGGSSRQSKRVHEVETAAWKHEIPTEHGPVRGPLAHFLAAEPTGWYTRTIYGNTLTALTASQASARGPHPQRLRIDEADELKLPILDAALGQPISSGGIASQVTISSTHQYPDGTMTEVLRRAQERQWPVLEWCMEDTRVEKGGWLTEAMIVEMHSRIEETMWVTEFKLQEPSVEGRQFGDATIAKLFEGEPILDEIGKTYYFEDAVRGGHYATGCDWGKDRDMTSISTWRYDTMPARLVAYERARKEDWPVMAERFDARRRRYPGPAVHDGQGLGAVLDGYLNLGDDRLATPVRGMIYAFKAVGQHRQQLYGDYILGADRGFFQMPRIVSLWKAHQYVTYGDIYGSGHVPDGICSNALGWAGVLGKVETPQGQRPVSVGRLLGFS